MSPEHRIALGDRLYGCDDCQAACPYNRRVALHGGGLAVGPDDAYVDVLDALEQTDEALLARFGHWYVPRRDARYLRRNLLYVLANVGDGTHARTAAVLAPLVRADDEVVRDAATWAADRLGVLVALGVADQR